MTPTSKASSVYHKERIRQMKIRTTYTERDLDFCYSVLIATVTAMFVIVMIWKVIA